MKLHPKYEQSLKFGATVEVLDSCYPLEKEIRTLTYFFIPPIEKQDKQ